MSIQMVSWPGLGALVNGSPGRGLRRTYFVSNGQTWEPSGHAVEGFVGSRIVRGLLRLSTHICLECPGSVPLCVCVAWGYQVRLYPPPSQELLVSGAGCLTQMSLLGGYVYISFAPEGGSHKMWPMSNDGAGLVSNIMRLCRCPTR